MLWFLGDIHEIGHGGLHLEGHLILSDPGGDLRIVLSLAQKIIEPVDGVEQVTLVFPGDSGRIVHVVDWIPLGVELDSLEAGRKEAAVPLAGCDRLVLAASGGSHDHEARELVGIGTQSVE